MINGSTDYALIDGVDVVFVNTSGKLWKYSVPDVNDATRDRWEVVGTVWDTYSGPGSGAYDSAHNLYLRTSGTEFTYWDLDKAGSTNRNVSFIPTDLSGGFSVNSAWGMEYDPVRDHFVLWKGDASVWYLEAPDQLGATGWTVERAPLSGSVAPPAPGIGFTGVLGKWDYVDAYDIFVGVTDGMTGDIWAYKPEGWVL
jgi:hypothetical protein